MTGRIQLKVLAKKKKMDEKDTYGSTGSNLTETQEGS